MMKKKERVKAKRARGKKYQHARGEKKTPFVITKERERQQKKKKTKKGSLRNGGRAPKNQGKGLEKQKTVGQKTAGGKKKAKELREMEQEWGVEDIKRLPFVAAAEGAKGDSRARTQGIGLSQILVKI